MTMARLSGVLVLLCFLSALPAPSEQKDDPILEQSFNLSQRLGGTEQFYYLIEFCRVGVLPTTPWNKTRDAASTLFHLSSEVWTLFPSLPTEQKVQLQAVGQKNAVTCLSYSDPAAAMEQLTEINYQRPQAGTWGYEDPRYNAAETIFNNFLGSFGQVTQQAVDNIIEKAKYLGRTGQYPYLGVAEVINRLPASFKKDQNTLLRDAIDFYATETGFYNRDEEFLRLLQKLKSPSLDKALFSHALSTFAQRLKIDPIRFPGDYYAEVEIQSNGKVFPFTDRNDAFLFQAFPLIRRSNPGLANHLRQQDPKLDQATGAMNYISGGFVQGSPTSEQVAQRHLQWLQESLVERIKGCQHSNPQAAARLAQRLTDLSLRIVGFSTSIPGIAQTDSAQARILYEKQLSDLENLGDSVDKLRAMVALVSAAYYVDGSKKYEDLSSQALDMGIRFFNSDVRANRAGRREGFNELRDLVTSTASLPSDVLKTRVDSLHDGWLKDYLWLYEAVGHTELKFPQMPSESCSN